MLPYVLREVLTARKQFVRLALPNSVVAPNDERGSLLFLTCRNDRDLNVLAFVSLSHLGLPTHAPSDPPSPRRILPCLSNRDPRVKDHAYGICAHQYSST